MSTHAPTLATASRQRGVSLIEALIAMLVMALGMVGIAALQAKLRVNSDVAKQRSEAVRIAEEDIENFRAFGTLAARMAPLPTISPMRVSPMSAAKGACSRNTVTCTTNATVVE